MLTRLGSCLLLRQNSIAAEQQIDRFRVAHPHKLLREGDGVAAFLIVLMVPEVSAQGDFPSRRLPLILRTGALELRALCAQKRRQIGLTRLFFLGFGEIKVDMGTPILV